MLADAEAKGERLEKEHRAEVAERDLADAEVVPERAREAHGVMHWAPSAERIATTTGLGRWVRIALTLGVPALLAVPRLRNAPRPLVVGLAGVAALLVYAVVAARVDGRFALLALPFTVPESSLVTVRSSSWWPWRSTNCSAPEPNAPRAKRSPR